MERGTAQAVITKFVLENLKDNDKRELIDALSVAIKDMDKIGEIEQLMEVLR